MNHFNRLKVSTRLALGFGCLLLLIIAVTLIGLRSMADVQTQLNAIAEVNNPEASYANAMRIAVSDAGSANRNLALLIEIKDMQREFERLKRDLADYDQAEAALGKLFELAETTEIEHKLFKEVQAMKAQALPGEPGGPAGPGQQDRGSDAVADEGAGAGAERLGGQAERAGQQGRRAQSTGGR
jgi:phosphoglycerate-specific signal transduction histidine kinase